MSTCKDELFNRHIADVFYIVGQNVKISNPNYFWHLTKHALKKPSDPNL